MKIILVQQHLDQNPVLVSQGFKVGDEIEVAATGNCDINNPKDAHYGEAGHYTSTCVWIADIG